jgi:hypothetical protein
MERNAVHAETLGATQRLDGAGFFTAPPQAHSQPVLLLGIGWRGIRRRHHKREQTGKCTWQRLKFSFKTFPMVDQGLESG